MIDREEELRDWLTEKRNFISFSGIAKEAGVSKELISAFIRGKRGLNATNLNALIRVVREIGYPGV